MADELIKASKVSTNSDFNEFLKLQADALLKAAEIFKTPKAVYILKPAQ